MPCKSRYKGGRKLSASWDKRAAEKARPRACVLSEASFSPEKTPKSREKSFTPEVRKRPRRPPSLLAASNGLP